VLLLPILPLLPKPAPVSAARRFASEGADSIFGKDTFAFGPLLTLRLLRLLKLCIAARAARFVVDPAAREPQVGREDNFSEVAAADVSLEDESLIGCDVLLLRFLAMEEAMPAALAMAFLTIVRACVIMALSRSMVSNATSISSRSPVR